MRESLSTRLKRKKRKTEYVKRLFALGLVFSRVSERSQPGIKVRENTSVKNKKRGNILKIDKEQHQQQQQQHQQ